ncbi:hypothetical protein JCM1840_003604 [Sporobolomyces johnsonii]
MRFCLRVVLLLVLCLCFARALAQPILNLGVSTRPSSSQLASPLSYVSLDPNQSLKHRLHQRRSLARLAQLVSEQLRPSAILDDRSRDIESGLVKLRASSIFPSRIDSRSRLNGGSSSPLPSSLFFDKQLAAGALVIDPGRNAQRPAPSDCIELGGVPDDTVEASTVLDQSATLAESSSVAVPPSSNSGSSLPTSPLEPDHVSSSSAAGSVGNGSVSTIFPTSAPVVVATDTLASTLRGSVVRPAVLSSASAVGVASSPAAGTVANSSPEVPLSPTFTSQDASTTSPPLSTSPIVISTATNLQPALLPALPDSDPVPESDKPIPMRFTRLPITLAQSLTVPTGPFGPSSSSSSHKSLPSPQTPAQVAKAKKIRAATSGSIYSHLSTSAPSAASISGRPLRTSLPSPVDELRTLALPAIARRPRTSDGSTHATSGSISSFGPSGLYAVASVMEASSLSEPGSGLSRPPSFLPELGFVSHKNESEGAKSARSSVASCDYREGQAQAVDPFSDAGGFEWVILPEE